MNPFIQPTDFWAGDRRREPSRPSRFIPIEAREAYRRIVDGEHDTTSSHSKRHHHHDHDHGHDPKVIVNGDHDRVRYDRSPSRIFGRIPHDEAPSTSHERSARHDKVIINGDHDHVRLKDHHEKVVVNGDHDHVRVHRSLNNAVSILGDKGQAYVVSHSRRYVGQQKFVLPTLGKRDQSAVPIDGVPGRIDIMVRLMVYCAILSIN